MLNTDGWSQSKKLKYSLLKRAFDENRGGEVILLIQWRKAMERHQNESGVSQLRKFEEQNMGQPRALRALNIIEEANGSKTVHKLTTEEDKAKPRQSLKEFFDTIRGMSEEEAIIYRDPITHMMNTLKPLHADHYDPMEGLQITTGYALACRAMAELEMYSPPAPSLVQ